MWRKLILTGLGTGYLPLAPGTWASAVVAGIYVLVAWASGGRWYCVSGTMALLAVASSAACLAWGSYAEAAFGRKDPRRCTVDEWAGQALALLALPTSADLSRIALVSPGAFLAFRLLDIVKPPPARGLQNLPGGWGILLDDLAAGAYANLLCQVIFRLLVP